MRREEARRAGRGVFGRGKRRGEERRAPRRSALEESRGAEGERAEEREERAAGGRGARGTTPFEDEGRIGEEPEETDEWGDPRPLHYKADIPSEEEQRPRTRDEEIAAMKKAEAEIQEGQKKMAAEWAKIMAAPPPVTEATRPDVVDPDDYPTSGDLFDRKHKEMIAFRNAVVAFQRDPEFNPLIMLRAHTLTKYGIPPPETDNLHVWQRWYREVSDKYAILQEEVEKIASGKYEDGDHNFRKHHLHRPYRKVWRARDPWSPQEQHPPRQNISIAADVEAPEGPAGNATAPADPAAAPAEPVVAAGPAVPGEPVAQAEAVATPAEPEAAPAPAEEAAQPAEAAEAPEEEAAPAAEPAAAPEPAAADADAEEEDVPVDEGDDVTGDSKEAGREYGAPPAALAHVRAVAAAHRAGGETAARAEAERLLARAPPAVVDWLTKALESTPARGGAAPAAAAAASPAAPRQAVSVGRPTPSLAARRPTGMAAAAPEQAPFIPGATGRDGAPMATGPPAQAAAATVGGAGGAGGAATAGEDPLGRVSKAVLAKSVIAHGTPTESALAKRAAAVLDPSPRKPQLRRVFEGGRDMMVPKYDEKRTAGGGWGWLWR